ncbi:30S ribosomal protein S17 [Rhodospirillaceae bacterium KN72]|uniref:Small ribosomal subunit protein uS17 n=1 Tax=Pacificispira spongiicola TaxID=2729598 RepID=A0A7Y0E3J2_9PROT|nr:30S ribosomal protein S17 [Pacificispira spongiicola]NMM46585.1 30S ribosomal protein S17 [Pacificispira spongiicola]
MPKRILQGTVVSSAAEKTVVVKVERRVKHPVFGKFVRLSKKFMAHDENNTAQVGDVVRIRECRPISKRKTWELVTGADA